MYKSKNNVFYPYEASKYDICCVGRSMIEMLGVLAIIAVLSVGGIAGYSKAMDMYKINKYKSGMYELIGGFLQIKDELEYTKGGYTQGYAKIFKDLDMIPAGFSADDVYFKDNFGLYPRIYVDNKNGNSHWGFIYFFGVNKASPKVCQAFVEIAVHFSADIWQLYRQPFAGEGISYFNTYGDNYCKKNLKCLKNLTRDDIQELCYAYKDKDPKKYQFAIQMVFKL